MMQQPKEDAAPKAEPVAAANPAKPASQGTSGFVRPLFANDCLSVLLWKREGPSGQDYETYTF